MLKPHPLLILELRDLLAASDFDSRIRPAGWQFIIPCRAPTAIEVIGSIDAQIERGPQVVSALDIYEKGSPWGDSELIPWLLRVPETGLAAVWFRSPDEDALVPLDPSPSQFETLRPYHSAEFFSRAAEMARFRLGQEVDCGDEESGG